jgi:hypothetical protein
MLSMAAGDGYFYWNNVHVHSTAHCAGLPGGVEHLDLLATTLFAGPVTIRLFSVPEAKNQN